MSGKISTFIPDFDEAFHGGLPLKKTTELCGKADSALTEFTYHLAIVTALPDDLDGANGTVLYLDTNDTFNIDCFTHMTRKLLEKITRNEPQRTVFEEMILKRCVVLKSLDFEGFLVQCANIRRVVSTCLNPKMIIINNVSWPLKLHDAGPVKSRLQVDLLQELRSLALKHDLAVVLINTFTLASNEDVKTLTPSLGRVFATLGNYRVIFERIRSRKNAVMCRFVKGTDCKIGAVQISFENGGFT